MLGGRGKVGVGCWGGGVEEEGKGGVLGVISL